MIQIFLYRLLQNVTHEQTLIKLIRLQKEMSVNDLCLHIPNNVLLTKPVMIRSSIETDKAEI